MVSSAVLKGLIIKMQIWHHCFNQKRELRLELRMTSFMQKKKKKKWCNLITYSWPKAFLVSATCSFSQTSEVLKHYREKCPCSSEFSSAIWLGFEYGDALYNPTVQSGANIFPPMNIPKKGTFQKKYIPKKGKFQRGHILKNTFKKKHIPKRANSKKGTFQKEHIPQKATSES